MTRLLLLTIAMLSLGFGFSSCNKEMPPLSKQEVSQRIDSVVKALKQQSDEQARLDLERRIKIEVKVKVDSIVNARLLKQINDTVKKKTPIK